MTAASELQPAIEGAGHDGPDIDRPGPRIDVVGLRTRWRGHVQFATAVAMDEHRDQVFDGLSLTLPAGRITVLLGARGAGKTLLACHLLAVVAPDAGHVLIGGQSVWQMPEPQRRELHDSFGVFRGGTRIRESAIVDTLSIVDNLVARLGRNGRTAHLEQTAWDYLEQFALTQFAESFPGELDSASRRRLALVLALAGDPAVVVIDDPGPALDRRHLRQVIEAIKRWHAGSGSTVLITVRSLEVARTLGQRVAVLRDGQVIAEGHPDQVLAGVVDDETFERRFGTDLGGFGEADPDRERRGLRQVQRLERRRQLPRVLMFIFMAIAIVAALLTSGVLVTPI